MGAHSIGHVHRKFSGYGFNESLLPKSILVNAWDKTPASFDNEYFISMIEIVSNYFISLLL
jgi:hypothetical protein